MSAAAVGLWSDEFTEVLSIGGMAVSFDSTEQAEATARLYPGARFRVADVHGPTFPASDDLLAGRVALAHRPD